MASSIHDRLPSRTLAAVPRRCDDDGRPSNQAFSTSRGGQAARARHTAEGARLAGWVHLRPVSQVLTAPASAACRPRSRHPHTHTHTHTQRAPAACMPSAAQHAALGCPDVVATVVAHLGCWRACAEAARASVAISTASRATWRRPLARTHARRTPSSLPPGQTSSSRGRAVRARATWSARSWARAVGARARRWPLPPRRAARPTS